jgi:hypothetical protein
MIDSLSIGPVPADEDCAQVGDDDYFLRARHECFRFIELIRKALGPEPEGAHLRIQCCPHDFGSYLDVVCTYDDRYQRAVDYAFRCESEAPVKWEAEDSDGHAAGVVERPS